MNNKNQTPIFIISYGRSGSTLISDILNSHNQICCIQEQNHGSTKQAANLVQNLLLPAKSLIGDHIGLLLG